MDRLIQGSIGSKDPTPLHRALMSINQVKMIRMEMIPELDYTEMVSLPTHRFTPIH